MQIVLADDDAFSRTLLVRTLEARGAHRVTAVADGHLALERALSDEPPDALLLDWMMPTMTGTEVCRRVRAAPLKRQPYILLVTAKNQRDELVEGLGVGADDLLSKPVPPEVLLARIRSAELQRRGRGASNSHVLHALRSASAEGSGELVVRDGDVTAHVYFHEGAVAWAHISDDRNALFELLAPESGLDKESARAVLDECRKTGARLSDVLVRWGLTDRASLRNSLQVWISKKLAAIIEFSAPQTLFLPQVRRYAEDMVFDLSEVTPELDSQSRRAPASEPGRAAWDWDASFIAAEPDPETSAMLDRLMVCQGMRGVAILDREHGCCFGRRGVSLNPHIAWALLQCVGVVSRHTQLEDNVLITRGEFHMIHILRDKPNCFVYAMLESRQVLLGNARLQLQQAISRAP
jgi:DNA-binding response OmpR family regulator